MSRSDIGARSNHTAGIEPRRVDGPEGPACAGRRRLGLLALALFVVVVAAPALAQAPMRTVEFADALKEALAKNPTIGQAMLNVTRADALVAQARSQTMPSLQAGLTNTTIDAARGFDGGITQPQNQFAFTGNVRYQFGGWIGVAQARDQMQVATLSSAEARQGVAIATAQAYLAVIAMRRQVEVSTRAVESARAHFDYADRRFTAGVGSDLNRLRARQVVTTTELQLEAGRLSLRRAQEALGVVLASDTPVDAGAEPDLAAPTASDEAAWSAARPDFLTRAAIARATERVVKDHWADWAPFPVVSFDPLVVAPSGLFQPARTWRLTIAVVQPLFDGGQRRATLRLRQAAVEESKLAFTGLQIQARSEVRTAQEALASLDRSLTLARAAVAEASSVLQITTTVFEVGAATNIEVVDAQRALRDAETTAAVVEDAARRARLDLLIALGRFR